MIGTAIRKPFGLIARTPRLCGARGRVPSRGISARYQPAVRGLGLVRAASRGLTAILLVAFVLGSVICSPPAHRWLDAGTEQPAAAQMLSANAAAAAGHEAPTKSKLVGFCTGHCLSHSIALPAVFIASATPFLQQASWHVTNDQWAQASAPARLERPPRV